MVLRLWRGWTTPENADSSERIVSSEVLPGIADRQVPRVSGAHLLRRPLEDEIEFVTIMHFDSLDAVRAFAGEDYEAAFVPPRARKVLSRFDDRSALFDVLMAPAA